MGPDPQFHDMKNNAKSLFSNSITSIYIYERQAVLYVYLDVTEPVQLQVLRLIHATCMYIYTCSIVPVY